MNHFTQIKCKQCGVVTGATNCPDLNVSMLCAECCQENNREKQ